jgi:hypothetical protein
LDGWRGSHGNKRRRLARVAICAPERARQKADLQVKAGFG